MYMISKADSHFIFPPNESEKLINRIIVKCVILYKLYYWSQNCYQINFTLSDQWNLYVESGGDRRPNDKI